MQRPGMLITRRRTASALRLDGNTYDDTVPDPSDASCTFTLDNLGVASGPGVANYNWLSSGSASSYEVQATINSGTLTSGTTGSWLSLSSSRTWNVQRSVVGSKSCSMTVQIRETANPSNTVSASITITATVE